MNAERGKMDFIRSQTYHDITFHHSRVESPGSFNIHCHDNFEIILTVEGKGKYIVENTEYPLLPCTVMLLPPRSFHHVQPDSSSPYERFVFHFPESVLSEAAREFLAAVPTAGAYFSPGNEDAKALFSLLSPLMKEGLFESGCEDRIKREMLCLTISQIALDLSLLGQTGEVKDSGGDILMAKLTEFFNEHLCEDLSLDRITKELYVSKYYLCRHFREQNGYTVFRYITAKRIALAEHLLKKGEAPISVAFKVGYGDYSSFYRAFRKITGKSPKDIQP